MYTPAQRNVLSPSDRGVRLASAGRDRPYKDMVRLDLSCAFQAESACEGPAGLQQSVSCGIPVGYNTGARARQGKYVMASQRLSAAFIASGLVALGVAASGFIVP